MMSYTPDEMHAWEQEIALLTQRLTNLRTALTPPAEAEIAQTDLRLGDLLGKRSDAYGLAARSDIYQHLRDKVERLDIYGPLGRLHLVNCNRDALRNLFRAEFEQYQRAGHKNHYYFVSACDTQMPRSFAERMVHEVLGEHFDDPKHPAFCPFNPRKRDRIKFEKLPVEASLESSKDCFHKFCARFFTWEKTLSFESALETNRLPLAKNRYSVLPFYLNKQDWKPFFPEYFDWIADRLAQRPPGGPTLLFFIVFHLENLHRRVDDRAAEIIKAVEKLCEKHPSAAHYFPLDPVEDADLRTWFADLGEDNPARLDPLFRALATGLPEEEAALYRGDKKLLNMARIELIQQLVFDLYNR